MTHIALKRVVNGLAPMARQSYIMGRLEDIIDPIIKEEVGENKFVLNMGPNKDSLHTFIEIAYMCLAETQDQHPTMKVVVDELQKALTFQRRIWSVFKGELQDGNEHKTIVAKRLDTRHGQGERQFLTELQILLEYKHKNLIGLVGYCDEKDEKVIVFEYASRGSLDRHLKEASLTWVERLNICIDVASTLDFLHGGVGKQAR
ncbi:putative receptor-like protein kinase At5g59700 [Bidens hawaiensis]|uniref:putative receptor-like protein kinase At5g59700 n=1 Tax=Bidens hawaiensis TaxID=980011 RepID=UPI00404ADEE5